MLSSNILKDASNVSITNTNKIINQFPTINLASMKLLE